MYKAEIFTVPKHRTWDDFTFLKLLSRNKIKFDVVRDLVMNVEIQFQNSRDVERATDIWYNLTGKKRIGVTG